MLALLSQFSYNRGQDKGARISSRGTRTQKGANWDDETYSCYRMLFPFSKRFTCR